jgi:hypothetical protein
MVDEGVCPTARSYNSTAMTWPMLGAHWMLYLNHVLIEGLCGIREFHKVEMI